jgi:pyrophosphatase PpaX
MAKAFLFDIDGTLLDTTEFILQATEHTLQSHGFTPPPRPNISKLVGKKFGEYYETLCGVKENQHLQNAHRQFQLANMHLAVPFPGTLRVLRILRKRGFRMSAVSTRSRITTLQTLEISGVSPFMDAVISLEDVSEPKPHPEPLLKALEQMKIKPEDAIMVGDSHFDIEAGKRAQTQTVRALYGFHTDKLDEPKPDYMIREIGELLWIHF